MSTLGWFESAMDINERAQHALQMAQTPSYLLQRRLPLGEFLPWGTGVRHLFVVWSTNDKLLSFIYPFQFYSDAGHSCRITRSPTLGPPNADRVYLFAGYGDPLQDLRSALGERHPHAEYFLVDWTLPLDLRVAQSSLDRFDYYVKRYWARSWKEATGPFYGDTNLMDYYGRRYGLMQQDVTWTPSPELAKKARIFPGAFTAEHLLPLIDKGARFPATKRRKVVLHAGFDAHGTPWYAAMRQEARARIQALPVSKLTGTSTRYQVADQLRRSQMCFSPFEYGEVTPRDYEAIVHGSVLVKPRMDHVVSDPNIFEPHVTYVPVRWDLADLPHMVERYQNDPEARTRMAEIAFERLQAYCRSGRFQREWLAGQGALPVGAGLAPVA